MPKQSAKKKKNQKKKNQSSLFFLCYHVLGECLPKRCDTHVNAIVWLWMLCFQYTVNVIVLSLPRQAQEVFLTTMKVLSEWLKYPVSDVQGKQKFPSEGTQAFY